MKALLRVAMVGSMALLASDAFAQDPAGAKPVSLGGSFSH
jgi:hypothetical protein